MPTLDRITVYPVKSLDGVDLTEDVVLPSGALEHDRRWQLTEIDGRVLNAKRSPLFHAIRSEFDLAARLVTLSIDPLALAARAIPGVERLASLAPATSPLVPGPAGPCGWLAEALSGSVQLQRASNGVLLLKRADGGFPDDREAPGPALISTASLEAVARWFGFDLMEARRRFRANLEIGGCDAFWEDTLASQARCRRCLVPSRDSRTGAVTEHFRGAFESRRSPRDAARRRYRRLGGAVSAGGELQSHGAGHCAVLRPGCQRAVGCCSTVITTSRGSFDVTVAVSPDRPA